MYLFVAVCRQVAIKHFSLVSERPSWYREAMRRRLDLLKELAIAKRSAFHVDAPDAARDEVKALTKVLHAHLKHIRAEADRDLEQQI
eukprot:7303303-Pyramimonas_sp.AAC.1